MTDDDYLLGLVTDLEQWNPPAVRKAAAIKLRELNRPTRLVIDRLKAALVECHLHDVRPHLIQTLEALQMGGQIKRSAPKPSQVTVVRIEEIDTPGLMVEGGRNLCRCNFCGKEIDLSRTANFCPMIAGDRFYCTFCLRNRYHHRDQRHVLMLTFRAVLGYYYYALYAQAKQTLMYVSEIGEFAETHAAVGLQNPVFNYDPESYIWFVDFTRVGLGRGKVPVEQVLMTISQILMSFNLFEVVKDIRPYKLYKKYEEAVMLFYHQRHRPEGSRLLNPTLIKTGAGDYAAEKLAVHGYSTTGSYDAKRKIDYDETRRFTPTVLAEGLGRRQ
jgi:hypothetical protein